MQYRIMSLLTAITLTAMCETIAAGESGGGAAATKPSSRPRADISVERTDPNSRTVHQQLLKKAHEGKIDVYFLGDSIIRRWGALDYPLLLANWKSNFYGWNAADFGWGGDATQNLLWRIKNGELDGVHPKVIVLLVGTNNVGSAGGDEYDAANIAAGIRAILDVCRNKAPNATIILTGIFPRNDNMATIPLINHVNKMISWFADGQKVRFLNINSKLADSNGVLREGMMNSDKLHPTLQAYQIYADELKPILTELLGPPAAEDSAPPSTGDPSAMGTHP